MIGNVFGPVAWTISPLVLPPLALLAAWLVARYLGWRPEDHVWSDSTPAGNRITRRAEAIVLLCVATAILVFIATNTATGGRLLILDQLRPGFATIHVLAALAAGLGVLAGVLLALWGRTSTGVLLAAGVLCLYAIVLNGPVDILESLASRDSTVPDAARTCVRSAPGVEGAGLYVNNALREQVRPSVSSTCAPRRFTNGVCSRHDRVVGRPLLAKNREAM